MAVAGASMGTSMNFTYEALGAAQSAYTRLVAARLSFTDEPGAIDTDYRAKFQERVNDDLDTAGAIAIVWEMIKDDALSNATKLTTLLDFDRVLGLNLAIPDNAALALAKAETKDYLPEAEWSAAMTDIVARRELARADKNWTTADTLREELDVLGLGIEDTPTGAKLFRKK